MQPGQPLRPAGIYDSNGPVIAAAVAEAGCEALRLGAIADDAEALRCAIRAAHSAHDAVILSGGTSKGAGDLTTTLIAELGAPGIVAHGVALKPGKPLCLAVCEGKPVVVLPGFSNFCDVHLSRTGRTRRSACWRPPPKGAARVAATVPQRPDLGTGAHGIRNGGLDKTGPVAIGSPRNTRSPKRL